MLNRAFDYMPGIREMSALRIWTGSRPATSDNLPYIGPSTTNPSVIIAAGHEGLGITTSLGTAELVVDEIMGRESSIPRAPYLPSRMQKK
jgi:glycine/D-amino acid oxidase-like deaminating enzyme